MKKVVLRLSLAVLVSARARRKAKVIRWHDQRRYTFSAAAAKEHIGASSREGKIAELTSWERIAWKAELRAPYQKIHSRAGNLSANYE